MARQVMYRKPFWKSAGSTLGAAGDTTKSELFNAGLHDQIEVQSMILRTTEADLQITISYTEDGQDIVYGVLTPYDFGIATGEGLFPLKETASDRGLIIKEGQKFYYQITSATGGTWRLTAKGEQKIFKPIE